MFETVNLMSDGLGLSPAEAAAVLGQVTAAREVAADDYSLGGEVAALEERFAKILGKPRAVFMPTGTLANHLAIRTLAGDARRVLVQAESHLYNDSGDAAATLSGLNLIPLGLGAAGFSLDEVRAWVERSGGGRVETRVGAISIETPVRRCDHQMFDFAELERICAYARGEGIGLHVDGARLFSLPRHSGRGVADIAAMFDTVYISLWKHFNALSGAILAGEPEVIDGLFHARRMFGGSLPRAWPQAALAARYVDGYEAEYARAWEIADAFIARVQLDPRFSVAKVPDGTSRFRLTVAETPPEVFAARLRQRGVVLGPLYPGSSTFPIQVNGTLLRTTAPALAALFVEALDS